MNTNGEVLGVVTFTDIAKELIKIECAQKKMNYEAENSPSR